LKELRDSVLEQINKVVVGHDEHAVVMLAATLVGGHTLIEGVPGVAKTLLARAFARALQLEFRRLQFTPDMLPSDVTGTMTLGEGKLVFRPGPVFTNILLADEINRTPPKTQAALLEAMQERHVTVHGETRELPDPFVVVATQNPIEYEGTYPLPEAQLDRFLVKLDIDYLSEEDERKILRLGREGVAPATLEDVSGVATAEEIVTARAEVDATHVSEEVLTYVAALVRATRDVPSVSLGASPRAAVHLLGMGKAMARLGGRDFVTPDDVANLAEPVLGHRLVMRPEAELEGYLPREAIGAARATVPVPR
jgi:MoxR-like ATPase